MEYLDFELPIKELKEQLEKCYEIGVDSDVDVIATCKKIEKKLEKTKKEIYKNDLYITTIAEIFYYSNIIF